MKPMIYKNRYKGNIEQVEILDEGIYHNYHYAIVSLGSHPCAYIEIPKGHRYYDKVYDEIPLNCHGGLTYANDTGILNGYNHRSGYWIGWDYAHYMDYCYYEFISDLFKEEDSDLKRWTTEEILTEVKNVIDQLVEGDNNY